MNLIKNGVLYLQIVLSSMIAGFLILLGSWSFIFAEDVQCVESGGNKYCADQFTTKYVDVNNGAVRERFCRVTPDTIAKCPQFNTCERMMNEGGYAAQWADSGGNCTSSYKGGRVTCWQQAPGATSGVASNYTRMFLAAVLASGDGWKCCKQGDAACESAAKGGLPEHSSTTGADTEGDPTDKIVDDIKNTDGGIRPGETLAECKARGVCFDVASADDVVFPTGGDTPTVPAGGDTPTVPTGGDTPTVPAGGDTPTVPTGGDVPGYTQASYATNNPNPGKTQPATGPVRTTPSPDGAIVQRTTNTQQNPYQSLRTARSLQNPESFIQRFAGNSPLAQLARFATGADLRNTPEGDRTGGPQVIYVTPDYQPADTGGEYRSIEEIASDISAQTPNALARVDHFARTLTAVGGPNSIDTENKAYGRIQDLIVEDEAIRALRVAEEEGKRAKDSVFCRANETAESCNMRREEKAKEVERRVFVEELEKRVLPQTAIEHFLAVYDGWVRPSPAPDTRATSTLATLHAQDLNPLADYELTTGGGNFVWWVIESVADATAAAIDTLVNLITGGDEEGAAPPASVN